MHVLCQSSCPDWLSLSLWECASAIFIYYLDDMLRVIAGTIPLTWYKLEIAVTVKFQNKPWGFYFPKALFEGLIFGGAIFNRGFFALPVWGAYTWRGLFSEFYGNLLQVRIARMAIILFYCLLCRQLMAKEDFRRLGYSEDSSSNSDSANLGN